MIRCKALGITSLFFIVVTLGVASRAAADDKKLQDLIDRGSAALKKEDYPAAKRAFESATQIDMGSIPAWRGLGWAYWELGEQDRAIKVWNEALRVRPDDTGILFALAAAAEERQQSADALAKYARVLEAEPGHLPARMGRARILVAQKRHAEAESDLNAMIAKNPANFEAQYMLAQIYKDTGREDESRRSFEKLAKQRPEPRLLRSLADAMLESGDAAKAAEYYRQNLQLQPGNRGSILGLARAYADLHQYREASAELEKFLAKDPDDAKMHEELARFAAYGGEHDKAIEHLEYLVKKHPDEVKWQLSLAEAYEQSGRADDASKIAREIVKKDPNNIEAMELLYKEAQAAKRDDEAVTWLERMIAAKPTAKRWNELGDTHLIRGGVLAEAGAKEDAKEAYARSADAYRKASQLNPLDADARLGVATAMRLSDDYEGSIAIASEVLRDYPNVERARRELYESYASLGKYDKAIQQLRTSLDVFPHNPRLEHELARITFRSGGRAESIEMMQNLLAEPIQQAVPILLYHGVSPASTDAETIPQSLFREHMEMLKKEGYQSISTEDLIGFLEGRTALPQKPVLITFDDARADSFMYADPILRDAGFKATMFVPIEAVGQHGPFNATWDQLRNAKASGRWDMQCHAHTGHKPVQIDAEGTKGNFLTNRMWLVDQKRLETVAEYRRRLQEDYQRCGEALMKEIPGTRIAGYAYPFGEIGHKGFSNERSAVETNKQIAVARFRMGFVQDSSGWVTRRSSRPVLPRFEVPMDYTAEDLAQHLRQTNPNFSTQLVLGDLYSWDGRFAEADEIFDRLAKEEGVDKADLLARRGRVDLWEGDFDSARESLDRAAEMDPGNKQVQAGLASLDTRTSPRFEAMGLLYRDNRGRTNTGFGPRGSMYLTDRTTVSAAYRYRSLNDDEFNTARIEGLIPADSTTTGIDTTARTTDLKVRGHEFEGQVDHRWDWRTGISVAGGVAQFENRSSSRFNGDPDPFPLASAKLALPLGDVGDMALTGERSYVGTAGAILDDQGESSARARMALEPIDRIETVTDYRFARYDDGNFRNSATQQILRRVWDEPKVRIGYQFRYDDANEEDPFFYTPNQFIGNDGVVAIDFKPASFVKLGAFTTVGVGQEQDTDSQVQASVVGEGSVQLADRFGLYFNGGRSQSANYSNTSASGGFFLTF